MRVSREKADKRRSPESWWPWKLDGLRAVRALYVRLFPRGMTATKRLTRSTSVGLKQNGTLCTMQVNWGLVDVGVAVVVMVVAVVGIEGEREREKGKVGKSWKGYVVQAPVVILFFPIIWTGRQLSDQVRRCTPSVCA